MINIENVLRDHGVGVGISKQKYLDMTKLAANGAALAAISGRTSGMIAGYFDLFNGISDYSAGIMDTTKTTVTVALNIGDTVLTGKVANYTGFVVGQELTIQDDVNKEYVTVNVADASRLETTPLQNAYKVNARVYRSLGLVDTVNGKLGFSDGFLSSTTYDVSTPVNVVASAYDTSGNGGRKLVRLSNGWLVSAVNASITNNPTIFYKSVDNGITWTELSRVNGGAQPYSQHALTSQGTTIYWFGCIGLTGYAPYFIAINAITGSAIASGYIGTQDSGYGFGSGCSIAIDSNGKLWAVWCSKNATYPNSFNIRVSSSTDGGVTWATPTQVTTLNTSGTDITNPCIIINKTTNYPLIIFQFKNGTPVYSIGCCRYDGTNFVVNYSVVYLGDAYLQSNPSAVVDSAGVIHVVWEGTDSTDTTYSNIRYSKSTDGGITWSTMVKLTTGNNYVQQYPSITYDSNNNLYVLWHGKTVNSITYFCIREIIYSNSEWGSIIELTVNVTQNMAYPSTCSNFTNFTDPLFIYKDSQAGAVKFRGVWSDAEYLPFLEESTIYNITPPTTSGQIASWVKYSNSPDFTIDSKFSIINSGNETYLTPTKTTTIIDANYKEDQYVISAPVGSNIKQKIIMTRANTDSEYYVYQVLGAIG